MSAQVTGTVLSTCTCKEEVTFKLNLRGGVLRVKKEGKDTQKTQFIMYEEGMEP